MLVPNAAFRKAALQNLLLHAAAGPISGPLDGVFLALVTAFANPVDDATVAADITEPTYPGYARVAVTWGGVWSRPDGGYQTTSQLAQFQMTDATEPTTIVGFALMTALTGGTLRAAEQIPPVTLLTPDDALQLAAQYCLGGADSGNAVVQGP